jgi:hypothetical protein
MEQAADPAANIQLHPQLILVLPEWREGVA